MSNRRLLPVSCALLCLLYLLGCGGGEEKSAAQDAAPPVAEPEAAVTDTAESVAPGNPVTATDNIYLSPHADGHFLADWPSGTGRLRTRITASNTGDLENAIVRADCTRDGDPTRSCSVTVWFELADGGVPGPDDVISRLRMNISEQALEILRQFPIRRDGMEGITVMCRNSAGDHYAWMEGFIDQGRILVVTAHDRSQGLFGDPEIRGFMSSVVFMD